MKILFVVVAVFEGATGIGLLLIPGAASVLLLGTAIEGNVGTLVARVFGAALISIAVICAKAAAGERGSTALGIVAGLLVYNVAAGALLVYAGVHLQMHSSLLWPAIVLHNVIALWCLAVLFWNLRRGMDKAFSSSE